MMNRQTSIRPRTIAIAGANGMVGRHLVEAVLARGERVIALVRSPELHPKSRYATDILLSLAHGRLLV